MFLSVAGLKRSDVHVGNVMCYYYVDFCDGSVFDVCFSGVCHLKQRGDEPHHCRTDDIVTLAAHTRIKPHDYAGGCSFLFFQGGGNWR